MRKVRQGNVALWIVMIMMMIISFDFLALYCRVTQRLGGTQYGKQEWLASKQNSNVICPLASHRPSVALM